MNSATSTSAPPSDPHDRETACSRDERRDHPAPRRTGARPGARSSAAAQETPRGERQRGRDDHVAQRVDHSGIVPDIASGSGRGVHDVQPGHRPGRAPRRGGAGRAARPRRSRPARRRRRGRTPGPWRPWPARSVTRASASTSSAVAVSTPGRGQRRAQPATAGVGRDHADRALVRQRARAPRRPPPASTSATGSVRSSPSRAQRHRLRDVDAERRQQPVGQRDHRGRHPEAGGQRHDAARPACRGGARSRASPRRPTARCPGPGRRAA